MLERAQGIGPARRFGRIVTIILKATGRDLAARVQGIGKPPEAKAAAKAVQLRLLLESLGPSFVKLGQLLSVRPDLVPPRTIEELESLQERVPPFPAAEAKRIIREELGAEASALFSRFDDEPLAAGSVAQVHRAALPDGREVVVKVRRPGAAAAMAVDLAVMLDIAGALRRFGRFRFIDPVAAVGEWAGSLGRELDFRVEGRHADRFRFNFRGDSLMLVPEVHWALSSERVLVMDFVDGMRLTEMGEVERTGIDGRALAEHGARVFLKEVLEDGFFHGDLHPANILITPDGRICYLDFGIVGTVAQEQKRGIARMALAMVEKRTGEALRTAREMGARLDRADAAAMSRDLESVMDRYVGLTLGEIRIDNLGREMMALLYKHKVTLPRDRVLLAKAMITVEGVARMLYPDFDIVGLAKPYLSELVLRYYPPPVLALQYAKEVVAGLEALRRLPLAGTPAGATSPGDVSGRGNLTLYFILSLLSFSWSTYMTALYYQARSFMNATMYGGEPLTYAVFGIEGGLFLLLVTGIATDFGWLAFIVSSLAAWREWRRSPG